MAAIRKPVLAAYCQRLLGNDKVRYLDKVKACGNVDPYEMFYSDLSSDNKLWPTISHIDIVNYLVLTTNSVSKEQMKAYKSMEAHNFFTSGFVDTDIRAKEVKDGSVLLIGKVNHSQSLRESALLPWILAKPSGDIITAHCSCMAGRGESCSYVGALLFALETGVRIRDSSTCTGELCTWLPSHIKNVPYLPVRMIDFSSSKLKKRKLDCAIDCGSLPAAEGVNADTTTPHSPSPHSPSKRLAFHAEIAANEQKSVVLRVLPFYCQNYIAQPNEDLPSTLTELYSDLCSNLSEPQLAEHCRKVFEDVRVTDSMSRALEEATKLQSASSTWFLHRAGRITASRIKAVCRTSIEKPSVSLLKAICYPSAYRFSTVATRWGCSHEDLARTAYEKKLLEQHSGVVLSDSGLHVNPEFPFLGATPDGLVTCKCCGNGVCEVKCPFCERNTSISYIADRGQHCLMKDMSGEVHLKLDHSYYYQIQTQMFICKVEYCDFVLWTENGLHVERVLPDPFFGTRSWRKLGTFSNVLFSPS